jgi:hypothetical protein
MMRFTTRAIFQPSFRSALQSPGLLGPVTLQTFDYQVQ